MSENENPNKRSREWCLTINNYGQEECDKLIALKTQYIIVGKEVAESGTPHLQIYLYFKNPVMFSTLKKKFPTAHMEKTKGSPEQNKVYCSKEKNLLIERGDLPQQGKRTDIDNVKDIIHNGGNMRDVCVVAKSVQSVRMAEIQLKYFEKKRDWKPIVKWFYGETGSGKTRSAFEECVDPWVSMNNAKWWEGYDGHEYIIIDDMRRDFCKFHELLKILDRYEYRCECKGGSRQLLAKKIIITTPLHPCLMYEGRDDEDIQQLLRRIDVIRQYGGSDTESDIDFDYVHNLVQKEMESE